MDRSALYTVTRPEPGILLMTRNRYLPYRTVFEALLVVIFSALMIIFITKVPTHFSDAKHILSDFVLAGLLAFLIYRERHHLKEIGFFLRGDRLSFDNKRRIILRNGEPLATYGETDHFLLMDYQSSEDEGAHYDWYWQLFLVTKANKMFLFEMSDRVHIGFLAAEISSHTGIRGEDKTHGIF